MDPFNGKREKLGGMVDELQCRQINYSVFMQEPVTMLTLADEVLVTEAAYITD